MAFDETTWIAQELELYPEMAESDYELTAADRRRMNCIETGDEVGLYYGFEDAQRQIIAMEKQKIRNDAERQSVAEWVVDEALVVVGAVEADIMRAGLHEDAGDQPQ